MSWLTSAVQIQLDQPCCLSSERLWGSALRWTRWARSHVLNPGLCLESPGTLPRHHSDAPTGPHRTLLGGHQWGHFWNGSRNPDGNPEGNHLAKDSFWTISMNTNSWWSGAHSKNLWICRSTVGPWKESSANPIFSDVSSPKPTFRSPELKISHSPHLRPLCRGRFRAGISERG